MAREVALSAWLVATALGAACALAAASDQDIFAFNGFGTLGLVHSSDNSADFTATSFQPNGAGYSRAWSASVDSLLGGQVTANISPQLSAVVQLVAQQNYNNTYWPHVEWANIKYQFTADFDVRIGRIVQPTFLLSDSRKVGFANPWVRPPTEVYSLNPITSLTGVDSSYRFHMGDVTSTLQADYGRNLTFQFPGDARLDTSELWGIFDTTEYGAALLHVSYVGATITLSSPATDLLNAFRQFGTQGDNIAQSYDANGKSTTLLSVGASYSPGKWFALGEWARFDSHSFIGGATGSYISGGYRIGDFTPYLTRSQVTERIRSAPGLTLSELPLSAQPVAAALNLGLDNLIAARPVQYTSSAGVRWDARKNVDIKLQLDRINLGAASPGTLVNIQPGFSSGGIVYIVSAALDFVF
jgi:hypothetical protein